jgi:hypothetical protein
VIDLPHPMSTFGALFRVTTYGESHCSSVGAIIDGCPPVRTVGVCVLTGEANRRAHPGVTIDWSGHPTSTQQTKAWPKQADDCGTLPRLPASPACMLTIPT